MAYIDLKQCEFFLEDGYEKTGAVNLMAGYSIGATAITVDGFSVALDNGTVVKFAGHDTEYTLVSHTGSTTAIVITPGLTDAVVDDEVITVGPHRLEIKIGEGNCTFDEKRALEYKKNRGKLDQVRLGEEEPIDVNLAFAWEFLSSASGASTPTVKEFMNRTGPAAAYVTTGSSCEPYAINLIIKQTQPCSSDADFPVEKITLPQFRHTSQNHDPKAGTVTAQGTCNVTVAIYERLAA